MAWAGDAKARVNAAAIILIMVALQFTSPISETPFGFSRSAITACRPSASIDVDQRLSTKPAIAIPRRKFLDRLRRHGTPAPARLGQAVAGAGAAAEPALFACDIINAWPDEAPVNRFHRDGYRGSG
jgi:hypothetical protein